MTAVVAFLVVLLAGPACGAIEAFIPATANTTAAATAVDGVWGISDNSGHPFTVVSDTSLAGVTEISFTESETVCDNTRTGTTALNVSASGLTATFTVTLPYDGGAVLYGCLGSSHGGIGAFAKITVTEPSTTSGGVPSWVTPLMVPILLCLSGIFSGLNLGLMALDVNELAVVLKAGSPEEQEYARKILPFRKKGNLLLCTLLLGNVLVNAVLTILLDELAGGVEAIVAATAGIVVFGEIVPQSVCSRHGLYVGAKTLPITLFFMIVTYPAAKPISMILDYVLGGEIGSFYTRHQLIHMLQVTKDLADLDDDEMQIVKGALTFSDKVVEKIMTPIDDVYMLEWDSILDFKTMAQIIDSGHSRIPVYRERRTNVEGVLYAKELMFVDPDDRLPLETIVKFYNHEVTPVWYDTLLDDLLNRFKKGNTHIVIVEKVVEDEKGGDNRLEVIGVATLEDVIEEIIGDEIIDEHDKISDNAKKRDLKPRHWQRSNPNKLPAALTGNLVMNLSEQMQLAALTYLSTHVEAFKEPRFSRNVLQRLLSRTDCIRNIDADTPEAQRVIFRRGAALDTFVLVLEGEVKVHVGDDNFGFIAGPFYTLGNRALIDDGPIECDFYAAVEKLPASGRVQLICVSRSVYLDALTHMSIMKDMRPEDAAAAAASGAAIQIDAPLGGDVRVLVNPSIDDSVDDADATRMTLLEPAVEEKDDGDDGNSMV